jgi:hypothetical protein
LIIKGRRDGMSKEIEKLRWTRLSYRQYSKLMKAAIPWVKGDRRKEGG